MPIQLPIPNSTGGSGFANNASSYYTGTNQGEFQFVSLEEIIKNFTAVYVGEGKILENALSGDISFHAHRALQELHYDTLKSCKSLEVEVCNNLKVPLPHDYVNYTKISWVDANGVWRNLYPTSKTGNPFAIEQNQEDCVDCGDTSETYQFEGADLKEQELACADGSTTCAMNFNPNTKGVDIRSNYPSVDYTLYGLLKAMECYGEPLYWMNLQSRTEVFNQFFGALSSWCNCLEQSQSDWNCGQVMNFVPGVDGDGKQINTIAEYWANFSFDPSNNYISGFTADVAGEFLYSGLVEFTWGPNPNPPSSPILTTDGDDVSSNIWGVDAYPIINGLGTQLSGDMEDLPVITTTLSSSSASSNSWSNFKSGGNTSVALDTSLTTSPAVDSDNYHTSIGARRGIDPQYAQANGSYFIDCRNGMIHFSSNIVGKTVVIQYISDGHGTPDEMIVHKFAEEAMYKWILYGCLSSLAQPPGNIGLVKRERAAETRKAKIRLSNIKIEEIAQVFRGKSKFIKH